MANSPDRTQVEIFGVSCSLRGGEDPSSLRTLAQEVDSRMREIASGASGADPLKVAVLAALRLADEARTLRRAADQRETEIGGRLEMLVGRLGSILDEGRGANAGRALDGGLPLG